METADNSFGRRIHPTSVQISVEGLGTQCENCSAISNSRSAFQRPKNNPALGIRLSAPKQLPP